MGALDDVIKSIDAMIAVLRKEGMEDKVKTVKRQIKDLDGEIAATEQEMETQLELRNKEVEDFKQALKDDADAIQILSETMTVLSKFYKKNKIPLSFHQEPEYTVDPNK